jgi:predicted nuclease of predicted toxin-antitoxin system
VRILLDEQLPRRLARGLAGHDVRSVQQQGWAGIGNGELLRRAVADGFEIFVTADRNIEFQQNLRQSGLCVVIITTSSIELKVLLPIVPALRNAVLNPQPGEVRRIGPP